MREHSFDAESPDDYNHFWQRFIHEMRALLRTGTLHADDEQQVSRLRNQAEDNETPELMQLHLRASEQGAMVTLMVRMDNLYVIGFHNGATWFELNHERRPLITGATTLSSHVGYNGSGLGSLSEEEAILGRSLTVEAIVGLSRFRRGGSTNVNEMARWLRTLIVNFIESVRLDTVATRVATAMVSDDNRAHRLLTGETIGDIGNWGRLSENFMLALNNPGAALTSLFQHLYFTDRGIQDVVAAARVLGMVLLPKPSSSCRKPRHGRAATEEEMGGIMLAEVIGVLIRNINGCDPGRLYGTITITGGSGTHQLFSRDDGNVQLVGPGGLADIAWPPPQPISGADDFAIDVDLYDHYRLVGADRQVARGVVAWDARDAMDRHFNRTLMVEVAGEYGSVEVQYAVLTDAVMAVVEVMAGDDGEDPLDVYGKVTATITTECGETLTYQLFNVERGDHISVRRGAAIPLQRKLVSVPLCSALNIHANLSDAMIIGRDKQLAQGSASFTPRLIGSERTGRIKGADGDVSVAVTWSI